MTMLGVRCIRGPISMQEHERCMLEETGPPCGYSPTLLQLITRPKTEREGIKFSPSSLGNCHRRTVLGKNHDWYLDVKQAYKMVRGTIIHEGLSREPAPPGTLGVVRELQMSTPVSVDGEEHTFHGTFDELTLLYARQELINTGLGNTVEHSNLQMGTVLHVKLVDYKSRLDIPHSLVEPDREHVYQINSYAYLVQKFLPDWLNGCNGYEDDGGGNCGHLYLNVTDMPYIDEVIVDELSITYLSMKDVRTFTSKGFGYAEGKQLGDYTDGKWHRRYPIEYEQLELAPIPHFSNAFIESKIKKGIKEQLESEVILAPPLVGERADLMCRSCPVLAKCVEVGRAENHDMSIQERFCGDCE